MLTTMRQYYRGGRYDFLLNSEENIDLLNKRFIVFEIDSIKENRELFPVVTIIIMEAFINKMRRLKGVRKQLIVEEAWKALSTAEMAEKLRITGRAYSDLERGIYCFSTVALIFLLLMLKEDEMKEFLTALRGEITKAEGREVA